jgi:hypothetical protein
MTPRRRSPDSEGLVVVADVVPDVGELAVRFEAQPER